MALIFDNVIYNFKLLTPGSSIISDIHKNKGDGSENAENSQ